MSAATQRLALVIAAAALLSTPGDPTSAEAQRAPACIGAYSDDLSLASVDARRKDDGTRYAYAREAENGSMAAVQTRFSPLSSLALFATGQGGYGPVRQRIC